MLPIKNPKHEIRNSKQIDNHQKHNVHKQPSAFWILPSLRLIGCGLFRISSFGFRILIGI